MFNIKREIISFFNPFFQIGTDSSFTFSYGTAYERWTPETHTIPSTQGIWLAGADHPNLTTDLYISYSATELICFVSQRPHYLLRYPDQRAFAALGLLPSMKQVHYLKRLFPYARWHLLFGPELLGNVAEASIAAWFKGYQLSFRVEDFRIKVKYREKAFDFDSETFSLSRFERVAGLRSGMRTHKPRQGQLSFIAQFNNNVHDS